MSTNKPIPIPLFDGLQTMLKHEDYQPKLNKPFQHDYEHAKNFLLSYRGSVDTFNSYRRDIERFLQWCILIANKTVKQICRDEFESFLSFCQNPPLSWIATTIEDRFIEKYGIKTPNKKWKPFLSKSQKQKLNPGCRQIKKITSYQRNHLRRFLLLLAVFTITLFKKNIRLLIQRC